MNKKRLYQFLILFLCLVTCIASTSITSSAITIGDNGTAYETFTSDYNGLVMTQEAYIVNTVVKKFKIKDSNDNYELINPLEIYHEEVSNYFYVVDGGGTGVPASILRINGDFSELEILGAGLFSEPQGVYVTTNNNTNPSDDLIYVADYGAQKVIVINPAGEMVREYAKPTHPLYGDDMLFKPSKIVVDHVGTMYIVDAGNGNGLVQLTSDGEFLGYFGANYTAPDLSYIIKFMFSSKEQRQKLYRTPIVPTNMAIDNDGLINTITKNGGDFSLKRLNIAGDDLLNPNFRYVSPSFNDIAIGKINNIYTVDTDGYVYEYDVNGNVLFVFGGKDTSGKYIGLFTNPLSIEVDSNYSLYVIDNKTITVFSSTKFCDYVHEAIDLYQNGLYAQSREPWEKVLQLNNVFNLAHHGIGKAYLIEQEYELARYHFKLATDVSGYSDAYWELRNNWLMEYMGYIIVVIAVLVVIYYILKLLEKKNVLKSLGYLKDFFRCLKVKICRVRILRELGCLFKFIKHPLDGYYEVKKNNMISPLTATILYIILFLELIASNIWTGFIFNPSDVETISIMNILTSTLLPILLFAICHYLISSITQGNGRFRDVYVSMIVSFAPVIIFLPFIIIISNFLTLNESFIYSFATTAVWGWSFILVFFMIKEIQELEVGETIGNILLTAVTMILFVAFGFLLYALASQIINFITDFIMEVISNG